MKCHSIEWNQLKWQQKLNGSQCGKQVETFGISRLNYKRKRRRIVRMSDNKRSEINEA